MKLLKNIAGIILLLAILTLTIAAAQEKPSKQTDTLNAIPFDRVVLLTLQALENNYQVKSRLLPNVHADDYYLVILRTAKRLALQPSTSRIPVPPTAEGKDPENKVDKKPEEK